MRAVLPLSLPALLAAQAPQEDLRSLLSSKVTVATRLEQQPEEAPSIVSVVTRADIERYGWRELSDILRALPGFDFANDGTALAGLSVRGLWAHEGKALLMIDGLTMSPLHNGNINYYGNYPAELIERVEVIRGPGSAVYGQFAGAAVIQVWTRGAEDPEGGQFTLKGTTLGGSNTGGGGFVSATGRFGEGTVALNAGFQTDPFSRTPYVDTFFTGTSLPQDEGNTRRQVSFFSADVRALGARIHAVRNEHRIAQVDSTGSGSAVPPLQGLDLGTLNTAGRIVTGVSLERPVEFGEAFTLLPKGELLQNTGGSIYPQAPDASGVNHSGTERERFTGELALRWNPSWPAVLLAGGGLIRDFERSVNLQNQGGMRAPEDPNQRLAQVVWNTRYAFLQYTQQLDAFGFILGGRYENSPIGHAFAPRVGLTCVQGPFNAKLLYGEAFRVPTVFQTYSTFFTFKGYLKPEAIRSTELELGWRFLPNLQARVNLYRMAVTSALSFGLDTSGFYLVNFGAVRTAGGEATVEWRESRFGGFFNLSKNGPQHDSDPFFLSGDNRTFLGVSSLKANLGAYLRLGASFEVSPSLLYAGPREGQTAASAQSIAQGTQPGTLLPLLRESERHPARLLLNLAATWRNARPGMDLRFSLQNLTDADSPLLQPYYGEHAPLPTHDRRLTVDASWRF
jgi:outer membrane receptor protein involved in Fe transport